MYRATPCRMLAFAALVPSSSSVSEGSCAEHRLNPRKFPIKHECFFGLTNKIPLREQALDGDLLSKLRKIKSGDLIFLKFTYYYCRRKESANIPSIVIVANYRFCLQNRYVLLSNTICADLVGLVLTKRLLGKALLSFLVLFLEKEQSLSI